MFYQPEFLKSIVRKKAYVIDHRADPCLGLLQNPYDLFFGESALLQGFVLLAWPERASLTGELSLTLDQFPGGTSSHRSTRELAM